MHCNVLCDVASVDNKLGLLDDKRVVDSRVPSQNYYAISALDALLSKRDRVPAQSILSEFGDVWIVVVDPCAVFME